MAEHALPLAEAYELITDGDRRPLLVLRECELCKGTDHALLSRSMDNEQTVLLTHWFRCVKLPPNVMDGKHPFHNLFDPSESDQGVPHLFLADSDGSGKIALSGQQSQAELWDAMYSVLERNYARDAKKSIKDLRALLSQFDSIDALDREIRARMDKEIDKRGPDSRRLKKMQDQLAELEKRRRDLRAREKELRDLTLLSPASDAKAGG
ncbi:MAG: hypothetical protein Fur0037_10990 [Planctomycetota bacterium]